jgi:hypothetical protein
LEELRKTKKVKEPVLTVEEKASINNKAEIKFTGIYHSLFLSEVFRIQHDNDMLTKRKRHDRKTNGFKEVTAH